MIERGRHTSCVRVMPMMSRRVPPPPPPPTTTTLGLAQTLTSLVLLVLVFTTIPAQAASTPVSRNHHRPPPIALPGCPDRCGNISIPYPFGIGPGCYLNSWFRVNCANESSPNPTPYLNRLGWNRSWVNGPPIPNAPVEIRSINTTPISLPSSTNPLLSLSVQASWVGFTTISVDGDPGMSGFLFQMGLDMRGSPFLLMPLLNTLMVQGCNSTAGLANSRNQILVGCTTVCPFTAGFITGSSCYGINCCQAPILNSLDYFQMEFRDTLGINHTSATPVVVSTSYIQNSTNSTNYNSSPDVAKGPTILQWKLLELPRNVPNISSARCSNDTAEGGYYCYCKHEYYQGNPYLPQGCQVIQECEECPETCFLLNDRFKTHGCPIITDLIVHKKSALPLALGLGVSLGSISMFVILYGLFRIVKVRKEIRVRQRNFKKNGGLLLQQQVSAGEGAFERINVFTCDELERATDKFNENRILGRGGQGTVYKGMLPDGTIVAIKKSKRVDESQLGQFINEVVILSQISHRNVVKLFGCCLETEVPLLVYEFILNGTLYEHIHSPREDFRLTWKMRLQIAIESAEALRYLHSSSSTPIYHRDIKTSNILLDERHRAKVSDFGISKTVSIDQTHVTTHVQGTFGYIDPEYFQTNQFNEKSDVYSFGIVLIELLTSKKPIEICMESSADCRSLVSDFFLCRRRSRLCDIVDANVLNEAQEVELEGFAGLAERCLSLNGSRRPTMKVVATTLQMINSQNEVPRSSSEPIFCGDDQACLVNEGDFSISNPPSSSGDFSIYTHPLVFDTDSGM